MAVPAASVVDWSHAAAVAVPGTPIGWWHRRRRDAPTVSDLKLVLDKDSVVNTGTESVTLTVTSVDASGTVAGKCAGEVLGG